MADAYIGEIRLFAGPFAPVGWLPCDGRGVNISEYNALYALIGNQYGGDGRTTFNLPDLRGRVPVGQGTGPTTPNGSVPVYHLAATGGAEHVQLTSGQLPIHSHTMQASTAAGNTADPTGALWAQAPGNAYTNAAANAALSTTALGNAGESQPHENRMPYMALGFIIATTGGYFPMQP